MKAQGKNIVVTGGGNGVGRELVLQLLGKGTTVFAVDINGEASKAAELIIKAMETKKLRTYIGKDCKVMNALYKISPRFAMSMINKVMSSSEH